MMPAAGANPPAPWTRTSRQGVPTNPPPPNILASVVQLGTNTLASVGLANPGPAAAARAAASRFIGSVWHGAGPGSTRLTPGPATARLPVAQLTVLQLPAARLRDEGRPAPRPKAAHQSRVATQPST